MSFKICTIGCGNMATRGHGPSFKKYAIENSDVEFAACCDIDVLKSEAFAEQFGFKRAYTNFEDMLNIEKPDAVCIILPVHLTTKIAVEVINKGFPVLLEKPPGRNSEETQMIIDAAKQKGVPAHVAFNRRYMPLLRELKKALDSGFTPEKIQHLNLDFYRSGRKDDDFSTTAIHGIDSVMFLSGSNYKHITFQYQSIKYLGENVVNIFMFCEFESGATAHLSFCPINGAIMERIKVLANDNLFLLNLPVWGGIDSQGSLIHLVKKQVVKEITGDELVNPRDLFDANGFYGENKAFFDGLKSGKKMDHHITTTLQSVEIAHCIRERREEYNFHQK